MSKTKQSYGMDFDDEASKLLEKALSSFDGIILGETSKHEIKFSTALQSCWIAEWSISTTKTYKSRSVLNISDHSLVGDKGAHQQPSANVLSAAQTLALALQQCNSSPPSPPDKETAEVINAWLESYMPVSVDVCSVHV